MPTYQYACTECHHTFEQVQSFSDASLTVCPECQGRLRKLFNAVGVVFKGSGFYRTDSRSGASSKESAGSSDSGKDSATSSGTGSKAAAGSSSSESSGTSSPTKAPAKSSTSGQSSSTGGSSS